MSLSDNNKLFRMGNHIVVEIVNMTILIPLDMKKKVKERLC